MARLHIMKKITLLAVLLLTAIGVAAEAYSFGIIRPTHFEEDMTVPGYDTANGPIRAVTICYRYKHVRSIKAESSDADSALVTVNYQPGFLQLRSEGDVIVNIPFPAEGQAFLLDPFDGTIDYEGPSGFKFRSIRHGGGIVDITDPVIMQRFMDVPTATITAQGFDLFSASGAGNLDAVSNSRIIVLGEVIYNN